MNLFYRKELVVGFLLLALAINNFIRRVVEGE
jgi:hypothetical protein